MPNFQYMPVDDQTKATMQIFRDKFEALYKDIMAFEKDCSPRSLALAKTKLEESAMWLNKALTHNE